MNSLLITTGSKRGLILSQASEELTRVEGLAVHIRLESKKKLLGGVLALSPVAYLFALFVIPCLLLVLYSFWSSSAFVMNYSFTLGNYTKILASSAFIWTTWAGMENGLWTAFLSVMFSYPVAYYLTYRARGNWIMYLVLLSWFSSYLVRVYAWRTILGTNGLLNTTLMNLGLIHEPIEFLLFSQFATVLTLIHIMFPFTLLMLVSGMKEVTPDYINAAKDLGATKFQIFVKVVFPMMHKAIVGSFMLAFILAAGDYVTPQMLGGREGVTSGLLIANQFRSAGNWPMGAAMALILAVMFMVTYIIVLKLLSLLRLAPGRRYH